MLSPRGMSLRTRVVDKDFSPLCTIAWLPTNRFAHWKLEFQVCNENIQQLEMRAIKNMKLF